MAHELTIRADGKVEMAYTGDQPWHGLGTKLPMGTPIADWRQAAGMDWAIDKARVSYVVGGTRYEMQDRMVLHRNDNKAPLGVVSTAYQVVQPGEVLEFFEDVVETVGLTLESAGTLFGGKRFWATAKVGEQALLSATDKVRGYLLLSTSADGTLATNARFTSVRVVCNNTLQAALGNESGVKIGHRSEFNKLEVQTKLGVAPKAFSDFMDSMRKLASAKLEVETAADMTATLLGKPETRTGEEIMRRFNGDAIGYAEQGFAGTPWGWLNSVTEYVDHGSKARTDSARLNNALFGGGALLKAKARDMALAYVG